MTESTPTTRHVVVMGVSGSGKSTVAEGIATTVGLSLVEADRFHPPANVTKMEAGTPLTDEDRWPWLEDLAGFMEARSEQGVSTVLACSALRRAYRDVLRDGPPNLSFIHLDGPAEVIERRMSTRQGHYMPASLLQSQIDTLEPLEEDESGVVLDLRRSPDELIAEAVAWLDVGNDPGATSAQPH